MKYFTLNSDGTGNLGSAAATRRYLKSHPKISTVIRWWWSGHDLIECEEYTRDQILNTKSSNLESGATAQWAHDHQR